MIKEDLFEFKNYALKISAGDQANEKKEAVVMFHGFPANTLIDGIHEKNIDIARNIAKDKGVDVFLSHYKGLGRSKHAPFSFIDTIKDSKEFIDLILSEYDSISIFGHSWGGFVTLNMFSLIDLERVNKVYMHAPFSVILNREQSEVLLKHVAIETPEVLEELGMDFYLKEHEQISVDMNPFKNIDPAWKLPPIMISQSLDDVEVPAVTSRRLAEFLGCTDTYSIEDTDHRMELNRPVMIGKVLKFL